MVQAYIRPTSARRYFLRMPNLDPEYGSVTEPGE